MNNGGFELGEIGGEGGNNHPVGDSDSDPVGVHCCEWVFEVAEISKCEPYYRHRGYREVE